MYSLEQALNTARLWRLGKLIGGEPYEVVDALLTEVERLAAQPKSYERGSAEPVEPFAHICVLPTKDAGPTKFFTSPSDPRGFPVYTAPPERSEAVPVVVGTFDRKRLLCRVINHAVEAGVIDDGEALFLAINPAAAPPERSDVQGAEK